MKVRAFLDKRVIDKIFSLFGKKSGISNKLLQFINQCDELHTYSGMWEKDKSKLDYFRLLGSSGGSLHKIDDSEDFKTRVQSSQHFALSVTTDENISRIKSITPVLTFDELISYVHESDQISFYVKDSATFENASLIHNPGSVIINDNYFFNDSYPQDSLCKILDNIIDTDINECIVITIFSRKPAIEDDNYLARFHLPEEITFIESIKEKISIIEEDLKIKFPHADFVLEVFENNFDNINHDRFVFTDFLCYKSEKSFHSLTDHQPTVIHRYPIFEGINFVQNVNYLTEFLKKANKKIRDSKNGIIQSYIKEKPINAVI